jgi:hypothetical protein
MLEVVNKGRQRGRVVVFRYGSAVIWGVIVCPEIGRQGVRAETSLHLGLRGRWRRWGRCCKNKEIRGSGPDAGRIKRGRVVVFRYGGAAIVIVCPEIGRESGAVAQIQVGSNVGGSWYLDMAVQRLGCNSVTRDQETRCERRYKVTCWVERAMGAMLQ